MESATSANTVDPGFFKPLVWAGAFAHTPFGLFYRVGHLPPEGAVLEKIEGASTLKSAWPSLDEARAEAQRDYNARLLSAVSDASTQRPASPAPVDQLVVGAEPVAWFMQLWNEGDQDVRSDVRWGNPTVDDISRAEHNGHDIEYLYDRRPSASPAPQMVAGIRADLQRIQDRASGGTFVVGQSVEMLEQRVKFLEKDIRDIAASALAKLEDRP